jgi:hypothetical protein
MIISDLICKTLFGSQLDLAYKKGLIDGAEEKSTSVFNVMNLVKRHINYILDCLEDGFPGITGIEKVYLRFLMNGDLASLLVDDASSRVNLSSYEFDSLEIDKIIALYPEIAQKLKTISSQWTTETCYMGFTDEFPELSIVELMRRGNLLAFTLVGRMISLKWHLNNLERIKEEKVKAAKLQMSNG